MGLGGTSFKSGLESGGGKQLSELKSGGELSNLTSNKGRFTSYAMIGFAFHAKNTAFPKHLPKYVYVGGGCPCSTSTS